MAPIGIGMLVGMNHPLHHSPNRSSDAARARRRRRRRRRRMPFNPV